MLFTNMTGQEKQLNKPFLKKAAANRNGLSQMKHKHQLILFPCLLLAGVTSLMAETASERLQESAVVLKEILSAPDQSIPRDLLADAHCVVVVPGMKKAAFLVGAKYGRGFTICRRDTRSGWGAPAAIRIEGGSFGFPDRSFRRPTS